MIQEYPLLSVIVPVYNTERFLRKCLDSLLNETYPNMEIIVVNDNSPDGSQKIIDEYMEQYPNIRCVINKENQGLFHARLRGYEIATGEYICSVDSDDYVGVDYHRQLILKALETDADIVVSKFVIDNVEEKLFMYRTYGNYAIEDIDLKGEQIILDFFKTEWESSHRWLVWNKVYKKTLWDKCYPELLKFKNHLIMLEDMVYGTVFMTMAKRYVSCNDDSYFYAKHPTSSTGIAGGTSKLFKNLTDQVNAFSFIYNFLERYGVIEQLRYGLQLFRNKQKRVWANIATQYSLTSDEKIILNNLLTALSDNTELKEFDRDDPFFYRQHTVWDKRFEELKKAVIKPEIKVVSFDIFDTLIIRPFLIPTDLFQLLNNRFDELMNSSSFLTFAEMRVRAEKAARNNNYIIANRYEEITIDEIYNQLITDYSIPSDVAKIMIDEEKALEVKFCKARTKIKEIFDLAIFLGKKVICITDMYLDRDTITKILEKNGYTNIDNIFISSEERLTKASGHLYKIAIKQMDVEPDNILHIGDNWHSDIIKSKAHKLSTFFIPKTESLFNNRIPDIKRKKQRASFDSAIQHLPTGNIVKYVYERKYLGIRCMMGIVANKIFDHPFLSYEAGTDFNRNPYYLGYYALGMHIYGIAQWLIKLCTSKKYKKIHFVARDGYMVMQAYKILTKNDPEAPEINYFYMSRKSLMPLLIKNKSDLYHLTKFAPYNNKTPRDYIELLAPILSTNADIEDQYWKHNVLLDKSITSEEDYNTFIDAMIQLSYSQDKVDQYRSTMKKYFSSIIHENEVMYDIGYSGRAQAILTSLLGYSVNAAYVHYLDDQVYDFSDRFDFQVDCYYKYLPAIIGKIREVVQSDTIGSCIGYKIENDTVTPILEENKLSYQGLFVLERMQQGACDFIKDLIDTFGDYLAQLYYRDFELAFAHEYFLHYPADKDMHMFTVIPFEDDVLQGTSNTKLLSNIWWQDLKYNRLKSGKQVPPSLVPHGNISSYASKWKKAVYYALFDRGSFKNAIKNRLIHHPIIYTAASKTYKFARTVYNTLFKCKNNNTVSNISKISSLQTKLSLKDEHPEKILFAATSEYGILCSLLLKLTVYRDKEAVLLISEWRKKRSFALEKSGIFSKVYIDSEVKFRKYTSNLNGSIKKASSKKFNEFANILLQQFEDMNILDFTSFENIIIQGNGLFLHNYLHAKKIPYIAYEEASGIFSNPELLLTNIDSTFPLLEKWIIKKYSVLDTNNPLCEKWYINQDAQVKPYNANRTENLNPIMCLKSLSEEDRDKILKIFEVTKPAVYDKENGACLVLTYPLADRLNIEKEEQIEIYATLADIFSHGKPIYFKPHPDDKLDYRCIGNAKVIKPSVLSELLEYHIPNKIEYGISAISTALNNLQEIPNKIYFSTQLLDHRKELIIYYSIYRYVKETCMHPINIVGVTAYDELLKQMFTEELYSTFNQHYKLPMSPVIFILGLSSNKNDIKSVLQIARENDIVISLTELEDCNIINIKRESVGAGYLTELKNENLYVLRNDNKQIKYSEHMQSLNITLILEDKKL